MSDQSSDSRPIGRRVVRAVIIYVAVPYVIVTVLFVALQRRFLYPATRSERIPTPRVMGADASDVSVVTHDALTLHGWWLRANTADAASQGIPSPVTEDSQPAVLDERQLVLCFPGNSADRRARRNDLQEIAQFGCDVLLIDYRGYGDNPGRPNEADLCRDARAIWQLAVGELDYRPAQITLFGESLGGAVAVHLAADLSRDGTPPARLIVSSTFDSLASVVVGAYPAFPFRWLLWDRWQSDRAISEVICPIIVIHGSEDEITPLVHGRALCAAAPPASADGTLKQFVQLRGRGHNDLPIAALRDILAESERE